jgi:hypothetical protein
MEEEDNMRIRKDLEQYNKEGNKFFEYDKKLEESKT